MAIRKIIHIDMDAFYASVEQRDHPEYRHKPIAVGGSPEGRGGVVATASYEARAFGVHSAMPSKRAQLLCPELLFVKPRFEAYKAVSTQIHSIFRRYTDLIEPLSLDEAYLDVTDDKLQIGYAIDIAKAIRLAIRDELQLTASAGVSVNKFVAKIASGMNKPDGLTFIGPSSIELFIEQLPVEQFFGVGKVTAARMKSLGLHTGLDVKQLDENELIRLFGKTGRFYFRISRGIDDRPVEPNRETKSLAAEDTFPEDLETAEDMIRELEKISRILYNRMVKNDLGGRTITLKIKYSDFKQITRSRSLPLPVMDRETILAIATELLLSTNPADKKTRLLGIAVSNFDAPETKEMGEGQLRLF